MQNHSDRSHKGQNEINRKLKLSAMVSIAGGDTGSRKSDVKEAKRTHHQPEFGGGHCRQSWPNKLCRCQGEPCAVSHDAHRTCRSYCSILSQSGCMQGLLQKHSLGSSLLRSKQTSTSCSPVQTGHVHFRSTQHALCISLSSDGFISAKQVDSSYRHTDIQKSLLA